MHGLFVLRTSRTTHNASHYGCYVITTNTQGVCPSQVRTLQLAYSPRFTPYFQTYYAGNMIFIYCIHLSQFTYIYIYTCSIAHAIDLQLFTGEGSGVVDRAGSKALVTWRSRSRSTMSRSTRSRSRKSMGWSSRRSCSSRRSNSRQDEQEE